MSSHHLALAAVLIAAALPATAERVRVDFVGLNSSPSATNVFGTPIPNLSGYVIYESSTTGAYFSPTATNYANAIKEVGFALTGSGGTTVFSGSRSGSFGSVQVSDATGSDSLSFNSMTLTSTQLEGEVPLVTNGTATRTFNNAQLTLRLNAPANTFASQALFGVFDPAIFSGGNAEQLSVFLSYTQTGTTPSGSSWPAVSYNYNLSAVTAVPEPATIGLLLAGLGMIGAIARRHRIVS